MEFGTKSTNYVKGAWSSNAYSTNDNDLLFLYCAENNWCGLYIPEEEGDIQKSLTIRTELPKNNQRKGIHLIEDYDFDT